MHSTRMLREGATPRAAPDILGHANLHVTQNVFVKILREA